MSPGNARRVLIQRRNWLLAKESPGRRNQAELSALDLAIGMLAPLCAAADPDRAAEVTRHQVAKAREIQSRLNAECSCHRCPVHGKKAAE